MTDRSLVTTALYHLAGNFTTFQPRKPEPESSLHGNRRVIHTRPRNPRDCLPRRSERLNEWTHSL